MLSSNLMFLVCSNLLGCILLDTRLINLHYGCESEGPVLFARHKSFRKSTQDPELALALSRHDFEAVHNEVTRIPKYGNWLDAMLFWLQKDGYMQRIKTISWKLTPSIQICSFDTRVI